VWVADVGCIAGGAGGLRHTRRRGPRLANAFGMVFQAHSGASADSEIRFILSISGNMRRRKGWIWREMSLAFLVQRKGYWIGISGLGVGENGLFEFGDQSRA
jgi:hypothetical protein